MKTKYLFIALAAAVAVGGLTICQATAAGFEHLVLAALSHEPPPRAVSWFDQLGDFLPRLALAAGVAVAVCVAVDSGLGALGVPSLTDGVAQIADQWRFTSTGL